MKLAGLRQRDGVSCGPTVAVVAGALLDTDYGAGLQDADGAWFHAEQGRVHRTVNRIWPRRLGMTPRGLAGAINSHRVPYRWRVCRGLFGRCDPLTEELRALDAGLPVAMLVGRVIPRHWVLIVDVEDSRLQCYEPSSGRLPVVSVNAVRHSALTGLGYPRPFAFVLPRFR